MAETAIHLIDKVFPEKPMKQNGFLRSGTNREPESPLIHPIEVEKNPEFAENTKKD